MISPIATLQRSVVAFPVRGRWHPYCGFLFPLFFLIFASFLLVLGALIVACSVPASRAFFALNVSYISIRVAAIVLYACTFALTAIIFLLYFCNMFNAFDSAWTPIFLNLGSLFAVWMLLPISVIMIICEFTLPTSAFLDAVYPDTFLISGIFGLSATVPLIIALFFSRFYEFCIGNYKTQKNRIKDAAQQPTGRKTHELYDVFV